jgi:hypothetical protein
MLAAGPVSYHMIVPYVIDMDLRCVWAGGRFRTTVVEGRYGKMWKETGFDSGKQTMIKGIAIVRSREGTLEVMRRSWKRKLQQ